MRSRLDPELAAEWLGVAVANVGRRYPYAPHHVVTGPDDLARPEELHPAFGSSFDWHSSVHMHWSIVRILRAFPDIEGADEARAALAASLTAPNLAAEGGYLVAHPTFERPYGWAWALALVTELARWPEAPAVVDGDALARFGDTVVGLLHEHLPLLRHPVRHGTHASTPFALLLALHHARAHGREGFEERIVASARRWFLFDVAAPAAYEPSGEDFLSPVLTEAHLMGEVLAPGAFEEWYEGFLPDTAELVPPSLAEPPPPAGTEDGRLVHLDGLVLSRAWSWRAVARALPPRDPRRVAALDAADRHLAAGIDRVVSGRYGGDHWLVSFGLLAVDGLQA